MAPPIVFGGFAIYLHNESAKHKAEIAEMEAKHTATMFELEKKNRLELAEVENRIVEARKKTAEKEREIRNKMRLNYESLRVADRFTNLIL